MRADLQPCVLVVDDEPLLLRHYLRLLGSRRIGFRVLAVDNAADALALDACLDGALVDLYVRPEPGGAPRRPFGLPLIEALRTRHRALPLALLSAAFPEREESNRLGRIVALRLVKPFVVDHLEAFIDQARAHRTARLGRLGFHPSAHRLSARERICLAAALEHVPIPRIAASAGLSPSSVKAYLKRGYRKLEVMNGEDLRAEVECEIDAVAAYERGPP